MTDVMPYVETHYRVLTDRANSAIAGLSMGGNHTLHVAFPHLDRFAYIGVYSSGLLGAFPGIGGRGAAPAPAPTAAAAPAAAPAAVPAMTVTEWEAAHAKMLDNPGLKKGVKLLVVRDGQRRWPHHDDRGDGRIAQEARIQSDLQGVAGRTYLDQLAQLSDRVRAATVSVRRRTSC